MGYELWYSRETGIQRKGTTFSELQDIFITNITTTYIYESLACCRIEDDPSEVKLKLEKLDFDVLGVIQNGKKIGYIKKGDLESNSIQTYLIPFSMDVVISDSTPLSELIDILLHKDFIFILHQNDITGIVTKADINKPIVRIYLFGIISLYELHLNYWINTFCLDNSWAEKIKEDRLDAANKIFGERKGKNLQLTLLECLQICDKKEILRNTTAFIDKFNYTKSKLKKLLENVEKLRNELAHSQNSIISNLDWGDFVNSVKEMKSFLYHSESEIVK